MKNQTYMVAIERLSNEDSSSLINDFISCGWDYLGNSDFANTHIFAQFNWSKSSEPIYPKGYGENKSSNPIQAHSL